MSRIRRGPGFIASLVLCAVCVMSCSHPINDDGNDITNPVGHNPGTHTLLMSADRTDIGVGESAVITVTYDGAAIAAAVPGNMLVVTVSDPSVIASAGTGAFGQSVGSATVTGTYQGASASIAFSVHAVNGISALLYPSVNTITGVAMWTPQGGVHIPSGSTVQFTLLSGGEYHNVVFDPVPGAPQSITQSGMLESSTRQFPTAGMFTFTCTIHGETGLVSILQQ